MLKDLTENEHPVVAVAVASAVTVDPTNAAVLLRALSLTDKATELARLHAIQSAIAIAALIALRNHAWKEWIRNSLVCFSICELEIRCSYAGLKS
uniref:TPR_REGION domain-containing protein n=1 Tax=Panagrellus redivivus TaxID=6233 RepID=A0A7E4W844_PANRE